jgi:hypothetical protein
MYQNKGTKTPSCSHSHVVSVVSSDLLVGFRRPNTRNRPPPPQQLVLIKKENICFEFVIISFFLFISFLSSLKIMDMHNK